MKITKRELNNKYFYIVRAGYCELQTLCRASGVREIGNASGVYGWNWTAYEFEATNGQSVIICTGYRDMTGERVEGVSKYENKAREIAENYNIDWKTKQRKEKANARAFADYVIKNWRA